MAKPRRYLDIPEAEWLGPENIERRALALDQMRADALARPGTEVHIRVVSGTKKTTWAKCIASPGSFRRTHTVRKWAL